MTTSERIGRQDRGVKAHRVHKLENERLVQCRVAKLEAQEQRGLSALERDEDARHDEEPVAAESTLGTGPDDR